MMIYLNKLLLPWGFFIKKTTDVRHILRRFTYIVVY
jgi:hypothetical protein